MAVSYGKDNPHAIAFWSRRACSSLCVCCWCWGDFVTCSQGRQQYQDSRGSVACGSLAVILIAVLREIVRLSSIANRVPTDQSVLSYLDLPTMAGAMTTLISGCFALRVAVKGNAAFAKPAPRRTHGKRAIYGEARWMRMTEAAKLLPASGGVVIGERYRVDWTDSLPTHSAPAHPRHGGAGGKSPLLCFDGSFGSSHGLVFAGSGGFKTTSVTIPTSLKWSGSLVVLDPSNEVAPMVINHRRKAGRRVITLNPATSTIGFNALDWIGRFGSTKEEDIVAVATWIVTDNARGTSARDDFFVPQPCSF